ncbi:MAG TPA: 2-phospho-L-lactate guanylyltransferase [Dehalococcoidia bacterium]
MIRALVPAKALGEAKGRLSAVLSETERRKLALAMIEDVVRTLKAVPAIESVHVVSPDSDVLRLAERLEANPVAESASVRGLNQALARALSAMSPKPDALLIVPGDVPEAKPADIERLLAALPERGIAICPSADRGTSALALRPPDVIAFKFGERSSVNHRREAKAIGVSAEVVQIESLTHDVDSPENLRGLLARPADTATHRLLAELRVEERLG